MRWLLTIFIALNSTFIFAGTASNTGVISKVMFFANGWSTYNESDDAVMVFYMQPALPSACGNPNYDGRIAIGVNHPLYESVVSAVLAAKISGEKVGVKYLTTCTKRNNSWDFGYIGLE